MIIGVSSGKGEATCPVCMTLRKVSVLFGNLAYSPRYMKMQCDECQTTFTRYLDGDKQDEIHDEHKSEGGE